jgi:hypothetical protein
MESFGPSFFFSSKTDIEFVRITALVLEAAVSGALGLGVEGAGVATSPRSESCAKPELDRTPQAAAIAAYTQTLILTPNLPLLPFLKTVSAVDRNAVLVVIAQKHIGILACTLVADSECDVGC